MSTESEMPAYLAIVSKRDIRNYADRPVPNAIIERMLQAGRATGSSRNRQPWRFYVVRSRAALEALAETVYEPSNIRTCALAIALVMTNKQGFDSGRAAQNIGLAAWADGVGTCPNGIHDVDRVRTLLDLEEKWEVATILSVGYPDRGYDVRAREPEAILERIDRKPLSELTHWID